jgi:hypothetical protein
MRRGVSLPDRIALVEAAKSAGRLRTPPKAYQNRTVTERRTRQRSYQASPDTLRMLRDLRNALGVTTDSAVIRRALALARVMVRAARGGDTIVIRKRDGNEIEIVLRG